MSNGNSSLPGNDRLWQVLSHASALFGAAIILPLIVYVLSREESPTVAEHAREALNFHISFATYGVACLPLVFVLIGIPLAFIVAISMVVLAILGTIAAAEGRLYRYPLIIRFVR